MFFMDIIASIVGAVTILTFILFIDFLVNEEIMRKIKTCLLKKVSSRSDSDSKECKPMLFWTYVLAIVILAIVFFAVLYTNKYFEILENEAQNLIDNSSLKPNTNNKDLNSYLSSIGTLT